MSVELLNMDCMEYMKGLDDNAFDLAIVDPPYRDLSENQPTKDMRNNGTMDNFGEKPNDDYFNELFRVSKNQIIWGANNFTLPNYKGFVIWKKKAIGITFTMSMCELAYISEDLGTTSKWIEIAPQDSNRIHPTQKPKLLYDFLLDTYAEKGQRILDTHLGSASSAIAAHYFGADFVGMELDKGYYEAACERFDRETAQIDMFGK